MSPPAVLQEMESLLEQELLTFRLGEKRFGIELSHIREIIRLPRITRLPLAPVFVAGVINLRGAVITVFSGLLRLGRPLVPATDRSRILILQIREVVLGLLVEEVDHVIRFSPQQFSPAPAGQSGEIGDLVSGIIQQGANTILRLEPPQLLAGEWQRRSGASPTALPRGASDIGGASAPTFKLRRLLIVRIGREEFAFPVELVREVIRFAEPNPIPDSPAFLLGVITLRDSILPIIDLRNLMRRETLHEETARLFGLIAAEYEQAAERIDGAHACAACLENVQRHLALMLDGSFEKKRLVAANDLLAEELRSHRLATRDEIKGRIDQLSALVFDCRNAVGDKPGRVVVVQANGSSFGLAVDAVLEILDVPESIIQPPPPIANESGIQLDAVARCEGGRRLVLLLRLDEMIRKNNLDLATGLEKPIELEEGVRLMHDSGEQWVVFEVAEEHFAMPIHQVEEIGCLEVVTRVPAAPEFLEGVVNLRGAVVPLIDLRKRFGLAGITRGGRARVVYFRAGETKYGLIVDGVSRIVPVSAAEIAPLPAGTCSERVEDYLKGFAQVDDRMILLLNAERLFTRDEEESAREAVQQVAEPSSRPPKRPRRKRTG